MTLVTAAAALAIAVCELLLEVLSDDAFPGRLAFGTSTWLTLDDPDVLCALVAFECEPDVALCELLFVSASSE